MEVATVIILGVSWFKRPHRSNTRSVGSACSRNLQRRLIACFSDTDTQVRSITLQSMQSTAILMESVLNLNLVKMSFIYSTTYLDGRLEVVGRPWNTYARSLKFFSIPYEGMRTRISHWIQAWFWKRCSVMSHCARSYYGLISTYPCCTRSSSL